MKKYIGILMMSLALLIVGCSADTPVSTVPEASDVQEIKVAVSIPPQASIVEAIGGRFVEVVTMIPPGYSPANYAPTQKEMVALETSVIYFAIDVPTEEENIIPVLENNGSGITIIDLAERVDAIYPARYFEDAEDAHEDHDHDHEHDAHEEDTHTEDGDHNHEGRDPHIWLSAKRVEVMVEEIAKELSVILPEQESVFKINSEAYLEKLRAVDIDNRNLFKEITQKEFLIYHPSLGYFAEEYELKMVALESEGKSATVSGMTATIEYAKENNLKIVFYQEEFDSKQARLLANEIGGEAVQLSPLNKDLVETLSQMGKSIRNSMK